MRKKSIHFDFKALKPQSGFSKPHLELQGPDFRGRKESNLKNVVQEFGQCPADWPVYQGRPLFSLMFTSKTESLVLCCKSATSHLAIKF